MTEAELFNIAWDLLGLIVGCFALALVIVLACLAGELLND